MFDSLFGSWHNETACTVCKKTLTMFGSLSPRNELVNVIEQVSFYRTVNTTLAVHSNFMSDFSYIFIGCHYGH
jgi:hypothetical protein